jgi:WXXGXW repeat (2 copies)
VQVAEAPPPLPDYEQPPIPADGYLWTPGYWGYANSGYYWVPGTWVQPPVVGVLWTPGYWGFVGGFYGFHAGYWGPHVGFYGGVNYGFGYVGVGFAGGRWAGNSFAYNRSVTNITNVTVVHNVYNEKVIVNNTTRVSFNGGAGGVRAAPTPAEREVAHEAHVAPTPLQRQHVNEAAKNPALFAKANGGRPPIAATPKPAAFNAPGVVRAHGATAPPPHAGPVQHDNIYTGKAPPQSAQQKAAAHTPAPAANAAPRPKAVAPNAKPPPKPAPKPSPPASRPKKEPESNNKE